MQGTATCGCTVVGCQPPSIHCPLPSVDSLARDHRREVGHSTWGDAREGLSRAPANWGDGGLGKGSIENGKRGVGIGGIHAEGHLVT